jgi:O-methyltransferase
MHNLEIVDPMFARPVGRKHRVLAYLADYFKVNAELIPLPEPTTQMTTPEQRINLWHLAEQVLGYGVPGDFVDLGCFHGHTSVFLAGVLARSPAGRSYHCYDSFEHPLGLRGDPQRALLERFQARNLPPPFLHVGRFETTLPAELPATIAFAQIDCGVGGAPEPHAALIEFCLGHVWPRLSPGGICVFQDYHDPAGAHLGTDYYPYIKPTVDRFLATHGCEATALYSGKYSHAFARKPV